MLRYPIPILFLLLISRLSFAMSEIHFSGLLQYNDLVSQFSELTDEYERYQWNYLGGSIEIRTYTEAQLSPGEYWSIGLYRLTSGNQELIQEEKYIYDASRDCIETRYSYGYDCTWGNLNGATQSAIGTQWQLTSQHYNSFVLRLSYSATCLDDGEYILKAEHAGEALSIQRFQPTPFTPIVTSAITKQSIHPAIPRTAQPSFGTANANSLVPATPAGKTYIEATVTDSLGCHNTQFLHDTSVTMHSTVVPGSASHLHFTDMEQSGTGTFYQVDSLHDTTPTPSTSSNPAEITIPLSDTGFIWAMYEAGNYGVDEKIIVTADNQTTGAIATDEHLLAIKVPDLVPLDTSDNLYYVRGSGSSPCDIGHNDSANTRRSNYVRPRMADMMEALARYYTDNTGLKISFNDASLEYGGFFDKGDNTDLSKKCHLTHREGLDIDLNSAETATCPDESNLDCPMNMSQNEYLAISRLDFLTRLARNWRGYRWSEGNNIHFRFSYLHE